MSNPSVNYRSNRLIPVQGVTISDDPVRANDGTKISDAYTLTVNGTIVVNKGSPSSSGTFWTLGGYPPDESVAEDSRLASIERKIEAIDSLFSVDYGWLEFQSADGTAPLKAKIRVRNKTFQEGPWHDVCAYTIVCEADTIYGLNSPISNHILSASEAWDISDADINRTYRLTHTAQATAKASDTQAGWLNAKEYVSGVLLFGGYASAQGTSAFSDRGWSISGHTPYNYTFQESYNELEGTYQGTENWTLSILGPQIETYSINSKRISDEPNTTTSVSIQGSIRGFYTNLGDFDTRYTNALTYYNALLPATIRTRCQAFASGVTLNTNPVVSEVDFNQFDGVINYSYAFSDKVLTNDAVDTYTLSKEQVLEDFKTSITIEGTVEGVRFPTDTTHLQKFNRAKAFWDTIKNPSSMYAKVIGSTLFSEIGDLRTNPVQNNVQFNQAQGIISYTYKFDNRTNDNDVSNEDVRETYNVTKSFSREDGLTFYSIAGQVEGLRIQESGGRTIKYDTALAYFNATTVPKMITRITNYGGTVTNTNPVSIEEDKNPTLGTINFSYRYSSQPAPCITGALSEKFTISETNRAGNINVYAEIGIPGRTAGPILQDMATTQKKVRTIDVEVVVAPTGNCDWYASYQLKPNTDALVDAVRPTTSQVFIDNDVETFDPKNGRYSRSKSWSYQ